MLYTPQLIQVLFSLIHPTKRPLSHWDTFFTFMFFTGIKLPKIMFSSMQQQLDYQVTIVKSDSIVNCPYRKQDWPTSLKELKLHLFSRISYSSKHYLSLSYKDYSFWSLNYQKTIINRHHFHSNWYSNYQ